MVASWCWNLIIPEHRWQLFDLIRDISLKNLQTWGNAITQNYSSLPASFSMWSSFLIDILDDGSNCSLDRKMEGGCRYEELRLDSSIWCGSTISDLAYDPPKRTLCFLINLSSLELSDGELIGQPESGVNGSWREEKDSSMERLAGARSLAVWSCRGASEVGAGVAGSVLFSESGQLSPDTGPGTPESDVSERTPLSRCCSSIIFFKYLPWASIRSCSCLWTCCSSNVQKSHS